MVHQFIWRGISTVVREAAYFIHHAPTDAPANPDITVYDPDQVTLGFTVCPAHIPDLRVRAQVCPCTLRPRSRIVLLVDEDPAVMVRMVADDFLDRGVRGVGT
jgi:hypothetical protein